MTPLHIDQMIDKICGMFPTVPVPRNGMKAAWGADKFLHGVTVEQGRQVMEQQSAPKELAMFYEGLVEMVSHTELTPQEAMAVLTKVLVLLSLSTGTNKQDFFERIDYVWEYENFFQPDSDEVH